MSDAERVKQAFVTGATGGIGSALCERLTRDGWRIFALVRQGSDATHVASLPGLTAVNCDLFDEDCLMRHMHGCDAVFHLAARVHAPPGEPATSFIHVNVGGTAAVVNAAAAARVRAFVFFSTVAVYAETDAMVDEQTLAGPATAYGASKLAAEGLVLERRDTMRVTVLRLPVVYGPQDRGNVRRLIEAVARGRFLIPGDGQNVKTLVAVDNVVDAAVRVASDSRAAGKVYLVTDERAATLRDIVAVISRELALPGVPLAVPSILLAAVGKVADLLHRVTGVALPISSDQVKKLGATTLYSGARIRRELGIVPSVTLEEGMKSAVSGYLRDDRPALDNFARAGRRSRR